MLRFILSFLLLFPLTSNSQALLGYSPTEIKEKFPSADWKYDKWGENKSFLQMYYTEDDFIFGYFFDDNYKTVLCSIVPLTQGNLQGLIEIYNKRYVVVDAYHWNFYSSGTIFKCSLNMTDEGKYYFLWSE